MTPDPAAVEAMAKALCEIAYPLSPRHKDNVLEWVDIQGLDKEPLLRLSRHVLARLAVVEAERDSARAQVASLRAALASMVEHWLEPEPTGHTVARDGVGMDCGCDDCESYHSRIGAIKRAHAALASTRLAAAESTPTPNTKEDDNAGI